MAKKETVYFALPIDDMRGKLATKQLNILYSGQKSDETAYDLPIGRHRGTNYRKFVVLTNVRGKNRFYVKSRTTVNNTAYTQYAQAVLALATSLAQKIAARAQQVPQQRPYAQILASYDEFAPEGQTLREYITSKFVIQIRESVPTLALPLKPSISEPDNHVDVGPNPFVGYDITYDANGVTLSFTKTEAEKKVMQKYFAGLQEYGVLFINIVSNHRKHILKLVSGAPSPETLEEISTTVLGNSYSITFAEGADDCTNWTIYTGKGNILVDGVPYSDEARTTALTKATTIEDGMTIYF